MSLAFLAKKSWHTANLRNVEKVWIAEQKHDAEEKKLAELRKNIEEERQLQELRQLQAANGHKSAALERVDWLYEGPMAQSGPSAEEYLLGKEYKPDAASSELKQLATTKYGSLAITKSVLPANDAFARLNEDPMMLIRKRQQAAHESVLKNPVKMSKIQAHVDAIRSAKKKAKKAKKEAKKAKKEAKRTMKKTHKHAGQSDDDERDNERGQDAHDWSPVQHRSRSRSPARHSRRRSPSRSRERHGRRRSLSRSRSYERGRGRASLHRRDRSPAAAAARGRSRSRSRSRSPRSARHDRGSTRDARHRDQSLPRSSRTDDRYRRSSRDRSNRRQSSRPRDDTRKHDELRRRHNDGRNDRNELQRAPSVERKRAAERSTGERTKPVDVDGKYGLIRHDGAVVCKDIDTSTLGPNSKFLELAREKRRRDDDERKQKLSKSSTRGSEQFTDDEKRQMAMQMAVDAQQRDAFIARRAAEKREQLDVDERDVMQSNSSSRNPQFLKEMQDAAYMGNDGDMSDRLRRNKHYIQRHADASNFMAK